MKNIVVPRNVFSSIVLCVFFLIHAFASNDGVLFKINITNPVNGKYIPIGVRLPANVIIDVLQPPEIDVGEYEICASIKVISTGPKKRCLKVAGHSTIQARHLSISRKGISFIINRFRLVVM